MNTTGVIRGLLGAVVAIAMTTSGPVLASGGPSDGVHQLTPAGMQTTATCSPGARACPIRIEFAAGAYSGQAHGRLTGMKSGQWFVIRARAGQTMVVIVKGQGPTRGMVYYPNGQWTGQPGGRVFDGPVPVSGDYRIHVTESSMGEAWSGRVDVVAVIY
jgi:hypothetical protein